jgi:hypothetical protein
MKILITERQRRVLGINRKPAVEFDEIYDTHISQHYSFPDGLDEDQIWAIMSGTFSKKRDEKDPEVLEIILSKLSSEHFPYPGVDQLSYDTKRAILSGMASCFNVDDIVWFSIDEIYAYMNDEVHKELYKMGVYDNVAWVMSPKTLKRVKAEMKDNIDNFFNVKDNG